MVCYCCVKGCRNNNNNKKRNPTSFITFHAFPIKRKTRTIWLRAIGRPTWDPPGHARICSAHFSEDQIHYDGIRTRIKEDAYPVNLLPANSNFDASHVKACRMCLATDLKMYSIQNKVIKTCMDSVMGLNENQSIEGLPQFVCYICAAYLRKCYKLIQISLSAQTVLLDIFVRNGCISQELVKKRNRQKSNQLNILTSKYGTALNDKPDTTVYEEDIKMCVKEDIKMEEDVFETTPENCSNDQEKSEDENQIVFVKTDEKEESIIFLVDHDYLNDLGPSSPLLESQEDVESSDVAQEKKDQTEATAEKKIEETLKEYFNIVELTDQQQKDEWFKNRCNTDSRTVVKCDVCSKSIKHRDTYDLHRLIHDPKRGKAVCPICKAVFRSKLKLNIHIKKSHAKKYFCKSCPKILFNMGSANRHRKRHAGVSYRCTVPGCGFSARVQSARSRHVLRAHGPSLACRACGRAFLTPRGLRLHTDVAHPDIENLEGSTDYRCDECDINFVSEGARRVHLFSSYPHKNTSDTSETPTHPALVNACKKCGVKCASAAELVAHKRAKHPNGYPNVKVVDDTYPTQCEYCGVCVATRREHYRHVSHRHPTKRNAYHAVIKCVCHICGKGFQNTTKLQNHELRHAAPSVRCEVCGRMFHDRVLLAKHAVTHTDERPHVCPLCGVSFRVLSNLTRHRRVHTEDTPYDCPMCDKKFKYSTSMKLHIRTVHYKEQLPPRKKRSKAARNRSIEINDE